MEVLYDYKKKGYFTSALYHLLANKKMMPLDTEIIPSVYLKEMKMTTAERLKHLNGIIVNNLTSGEDTKSVLDFTPKIIVFQNYKAHEKTTAKFSVRNTSNAPVCLNMVFKESSSFFIKPWGGELLSRLAPGINISFVITFLPQAYEDYVHRVNFVTDKQQYALPLIGMGPKPIFDFPDEIIIPPTPLKIENFVTIPIHNVSPLAGGFKVIAKCPFSTHPKLCYIIANQKVNLKVTFKSMHLGESEGKMLMELETEEIFAIKLKGSTHTVSIELEKVLIRFFDTYIGMARQQCLKVTNRSDHLITYMCMKNDSIYNDFEDKLKLAKVFYDVKESEAAKYRKLVYYDVVTSEEHERVYTRIFFDEIQPLVTDETLYFNDLHFSISPIKGQLWPNETTSLTVTFAPTEIGDFVAVAYLDLDGISERVPLTIQGTSLAPNIHLHLENLDMDKVYINKTYNYEIVALNKGHINGLIQYKETPVLFGSIISCSPEKHCLGPGDRNVFVLSFSNSNPGPFFEEVNFFIKDTDIVRKLYLKGTVIYPTLIFSLPCLDFENVHVGIPKTLHVDIINESDVHVNGTLKISSDGPDVNSVTLEDCEACDDVAQLLQLPTWPKEFTIDPSKVALGASSSLTVRVTLIANLVRNNQTLLELELEKSDSNPITLQILYNARVPDITCAPDIQLRSCFLDYVYNYDVIISSNEFWGYFIIEEPPEEYLQVNVGIKRSIIRPNTTISLPVTIATSVLGCHEYTIRMHLFGFPQAIDICHIKANGVRPIVTCNPFNLHFGHIKLLTRTQRALTLCNDSPVTVYFKTGMLNRDGRWTVEPGEGLIEAESETELTVSVCLVDADACTNKVIIHMEKVKDIYVPLVVIGVGTSIVVGSGQDHVDLGRHFFKIPLEVPIELKNCGTRLHALEWSAHYKQPKTLTPEPPFYNIEPKSLKIAGGESTHLKITGMSPKTGYVKETWYLVGSVEGVNKKDLLMECEISGEFVEPKIILSTNDISLQHDYGPFSEYYKLTDIVTIQNVSRLPLTIDISAKPPFAIVHRETYIVPAQEVNTCCCINVEESDLSLQRVINEAELPESKVFIDCISKKPLQRSRQEPLNFFQNINKIKLAFDFTQFVEQTLEDKEIMKLQIVFDTTKHLTLKSKIYCDIMRIRFRGHKNKDAVKITGKINFPNVIVYTPKIDFECILNGSVESKLLKIHNPTGLVVCYSFMWRKCYTTIIKMPEILRPVEEKFSEPKVPTEEINLSVPMEELMQEATLDKIDQEQTTDAGESQQNLMLEPVTSVHATELEDEMMKTRILQKITPMIKIESDFNFQWGYKLNKLQKHMFVQINDIFLLTPHQGKLSPGETQHIHVIFRPIDNICIRALLEMEVLGGPSEFITVCGQSSELMYKLNTQALNFKIRSFHENASENLIITNLVNLAFEYKTYLNEPVFENDLPAKIIEIRPPSKVLSAEEEINVAVVMRPGVMGYFKRVFLLEIGFLPHIPIQVFGWGVFPQMYFLLPRPGISHINVEIGYEAIATLTEEYLDAIYEIYKRTSERTHSPDFDKCFEDPDLQENWHICSSWDGYPTVMDIELAIERCLVVKHITTRRDIMTMYINSTKNIPIPGFNTTPYMVDFGVIITGNSVTCVVDVINYGPIPVKLHNKTPINRNWLNVKYCARLNPGEMGKMEIKFSPTTHDFHEVEQYLDITLHFEVPYGVTIPLTIKSLIAVPFLKSNITVLDLGSVRCGDKIIAYVPLANVGKPACVWFVTLKLRTPGPNPITILESSGMYEPGEGGLLSIAFKPTMEMLYEGMLIFRFHMNPTRMTIPVVGRGLFPHAHVIGPVLNFPATLPWAEITEIYFGITNPCPFPIALVIAHYDGKWKEEEELYNLLYKYYNKPDEMLVPAIRPGIAEMPVEITEFYRRFKTNVQKAIADEAAMAAKLTSSARGAAAAKKVKSPKNTKVKETVDKETSPIRKKRTDAEIMADEIKAMKEAGLDPIKNCLHIADNLHESDKSEKGLLLFLNGSPSEEESAKEMAYYLGMKLDLPTISLDSCFIEALLTTANTSCPAKSAIMAALDDNLENMKRMYSSSDNDYESVDDLYHFGESLDEYEVVAKKVDLFLMNKNVPMSRSKTSDKKKKEVSSGGGASQAGDGNSLFQMELIQELLTDFFTQEKFSRGFVVDSLICNVIKIPTLALTTVLKSKPTICNIHLILFQLEFNRWVTKYEQGLREAEKAEELETTVKVYTKEEIDEIVENFEEMDAEEYENADPELKSIYVKQVFEERKMKFFQKHPRKHMDIIKNKERAMKEQSGILPTMILSDSKRSKGAKKEDLKSGKVEYANMQIRYNEYQKNVYEGLVSIACNWIMEDLEMSFPLYSINGQELGASVKKGGGKKPKSEISHMSIDYEEEEKERGFPLTIVMGPCFEFKEGILDLFNCPYVQKKLKPPEKTDPLQCSVRREEYTVLLPKTLPAITLEESLQWRFLDEAPIRKCECNQITDINLLDDSTQENVLNILSKWHCTCGKRVTSSQTSTSEIPSESYQRDTVEEEEAFLYPMPMHSVRSLDAPRQRIVLQPGDLMRCKYSFSPIVEGNFSIKRFVEVAGWPESRVVINVSGICDLPRLDNRPKKMFANFVRRTLEGEVYKRTFLDDLKKFEFGPIFVGKDRIYEEEYTIDLRNASLLPTDVIIEFIWADDIFKIDKDFISLQPGGRGQVTVSAAPSIVGDHDINLLICVKDNPEIIRINISCKGVIPSLEILPLCKTIDYGKHLLYRREDDRFIVKNDSILPIKWNVRNTDDFAEDFIISRTTGIVQRYDNHVVPVTYIACNVGVISNQALIIDIYDEFGRGEPMLVDSLWLSAECYDVMVECAFENPNESFLNFGNVKVNSPAYRDMYLLNRGKYNIYYKLKKVKKFPEPALLKSFNATPDCGLIQPGMRLASIEFECCPTTSVNLNNVPVYNCSLLDGSKDQVVVAKFPVYVTIASFYNTFTLFPLGELNFHIIPVGIGVMKELVLNNTSKCPFNYDIVVPEEHYVDPASLPPPKPGKDNKFRNPPIKCGNFLIMNEDNLLAPGASRTIPIQFLATGAKTFEETIYFIVSDTCPAESTGVPLKLVGTGAMPLLDFWNLDNTFREHLIVKNLEEYKVPESSPHCVFVEDSVTFHFFCVSINTSFSAKIDLYNSGVVPCILKLSLNYQQNTNDNVFYLDKYDLQIESLMHKRLTITFAPKELVEYRAVLIVKLQLLQNEEQTYQLCLIGEGAIPRIRLLKPPVRAPKLALLNFPLTCLGSISHKNVRFKNISTIDTTVNITVKQPEDERPVFSIAPSQKCKPMVIGDPDLSEYLKLSLLLKPKEVAELQVYFNPLVKSRINCDIKLKIKFNPYEYYTIMCEAEAFAEDVILIGLDMLPMDFDIDALKYESGMAVGIDLRKKSKSTPADKKAKDKTNLTLGPNGEILEPAVLKYIMDFGGCELATARKRSIVMLNNSEKVYKFTWELVERIVIKPTIGYISPGEEKDIEIMFFSEQPVAIKKEIFNCHLIAISDESLTLDAKTFSWDSRHKQTIFDLNPETGQTERHETVIEEPRPGNDEVLGFIDMIVVYSATTEFTKYVCNLSEKRTLKDIYIYQKRTFEFKVDNVSSVPMKISWDFFIEDEYPGRLDKRRLKESASPEAPPEEGSLDESNMNHVDNKSLVPSNPNEGSKDTLFSGSVDRDSVDTWFEMDLPFSIEPKRACIEPRKSQIFKVTFSPLEVFDFTVRLRSTIDNLDPYDQNMSCKIMARSLTPYVHLDLEESDYLESDRRKPTGFKLPPHMQVLEFNVLGAGCYKKTFQVINPTSEGYEFAFLPILSDETLPSTVKEFKPVHCNKLKGYLEGGTSTDVTFTFSPNLAGVYEALWNFEIKVLNLVIPLMVVGLVREPDVSFVPTIICLKNSLVGFTTTHVVKLRNEESEPVGFEFKGHSIVNEAGDNVIVVCPDKGLLKPQSDLEVTIYYTPIEDGPISFKIFCQIANMKRVLTLCVNALSHLIKPTIKYYIVGNEHLLDYNVVTNIHLEQTASAHERIVPFKIKNDGSTAFTFEWDYVVTPVRKYLTVDLEPRSGFIAPGVEQECLMHFKLKTVPVLAYPVTLSISNGPEYQIYLYAEIEKPSYNFSFEEYDFGKCIIGAPDRTYKKSLAFTNNSKEDITLDLATDNTADLYVNYRHDSVVKPRKRVKIPIFFRPSLNQLYEFKIQFWVNSLCEENIILRGEGVPLILDIYEGCQKSFDLGPVKVGEKIVREIDVMNFSKVPVECHFFFKEIYPFIKTVRTLDSESLGTSVCLDPNTPGQRDNVDVGPSRNECVRLYREEQKRNQIEQDITNALASLKVVPAKCVIQPHMKTSLKIHFKPIGLISELNVQLNVNALSMIRPLALFSGSATGMCLRFNMNSLQFGRVRKRGCKVLKVMLLNTGDLYASYWWQPLLSDEFTIRPMKGIIDAKSNLTFTVTYRPNEHNPYVKVWASCNIENYKTLEVALYATCADFGIPQHQTLYLECPTRKSITEYVSIINPTDENWQITSEITGQDAASFTTDREFYIEAQSTVDIPVIFKPKVYGKHEAQVLLSPLGETALFVMLIGAAVHPDPNGIINIKVEAKKTHIEHLPVHNITEKSELYIVGTEVIKVMPEKFEGYYEIKYPDTIRVWGEASCTCKWTFVCFEECEMSMRVMFINDTTREYQYYDINAEVTPSLTKGTLNFKCRAREYIQRDLTLANPLGEDIEFTVVCEKLQCYQNLKVSRNTQAKLTLTFSPLVVGEWEDVLTVENHLIGVSVYRVIGTCTPAKEKSLEVSTPFGSIIPLRLRVCNKAPVSTSFSATTNHSSIILDKEYYDLPAQEKGKFLVYFEPSELGVQNIRVSFNSHDAGEFVFNIKGTATEPKPLGPIDVKAGSFALIKFKNVFDETRSFRIFVDRDDFYIKTTIEQLKPKKDIRVAVYLDRPQYAWKQPPTGCLTIENYAPEDPKVHWTYFLQGKL